MPGHYVTAFFSGFRRRIEAFILDSTRSPATRARRRTRAAL